MNNKIITVRKLDILLKRIYPNLTKVHCLAFGVRYVYYTDESLSIKICDALYLSIFDSQKLFNLSNDSFLKRLKIKYFFQSDKLVKISC